MRPGGGRSRGCSVSLAGLSPGRGRCTKRGAIPQTARLYAQAAVSWCSLSQTLTSPSQTLMLSRYHLMRRRLFRAAHVADLAEQMPFVPRRARPGGGLPQLLEPLPGVFVGRGVCALLPTPPPNRARVLPRSGATA